MVTELNVYEEIRRMRLEGECSQRKVAEILGISRNTVRKYWDGEFVPWEKKIYERDPTIITDEVIAFINACLDEDEVENVKKQRHTARRIFNRLVEERDYKGCESSIRRAVHEIKLSRKPDQAFIPLSFSLGEAMQVDWGEAQVYVNGEKVQVNIFCARLCGSCAPFTIAYWHQNLESFLDAIIRSIQYYGGTPKKIIFDNARVAVKNGFGAHAVAQDNYAILSAHYGFTPVFCNPASGNEKGLVENLVGYIRRNVCVPLPKVNSLEELNAKLLEQCTKYLNHTIDGRTSNVGTILEEEKKALQPLPKYTPDISKKAYPKVGRYSTVLFETNQYSVPCKYTGKDTMVKGFPNRVEVWIEGNMVAAHNRLNGKKCESLDLAHYLSILSHRGRAISFAKPIKNTFPTEFINWIESKHFNSKELTEILQRSLEIGYVAVMSNESPLQVANPVQDPVVEINVDLSAYDTLCSKEAMS